MISRRRFIALSAAFAIAPRPALARSVNRWRGTALGAEADITLYGPTDWADGLLNDARQILESIDNLFSLHKPTSSLARLNADSVLSEPNRDFHQLLDSVDYVHHLTGGLFDPTVQPLWQALAEGGDTDNARQLIGWHRVKRDGERLELDTGQALTLNGIAQGFATDLIAEAFRRSGAEKTLVNIGEFRSLGGPWQIGISDPVHGLIGKRTLTNRAIATSSPGALSFSGSDTHILDPSGPAPAHWSTVSVEANNATLADGLSTALCHADFETIQTIKKRAPEIRRITLINHDGDLITT